MRNCRVEFLPRRFLLAAVMGLSVVGDPLLAQVPKPTGAPLVLSQTETEQEIPLAYLQPDGKTAKCAPVKLHWISKPDAGANEDAIAFSIDLPADNPAAPLFTAQLWNASLASAVAWQEPWQGARWKVLQTPATDGTGIDAALAVGMIATSARRPYPAKTLVIGHLNPDGSLGPVSHLSERISAAARSGISRIIIPSVQRFDTDASGQVVNIVRAITDEHLECIPVDNLVQAVETAMNDPLPDPVTLNTAVPKYNYAVTGYIEAFAHREQNEATAGLKFAPKESEIGTYPPRLQAIWKSIYADYESGQQAYGAGQIYVAHQLFMRVNGRMAGANALAGQSRASFDVKAALAQSDDLHDHLHILMNPPSIDRSSLESAVLVAEMADWAFDVNAQIEGAQLVTKQAFSQRSDATEAEKDRAREAILFANEQCKYLLTEADFYTGLLNKVARSEPINVDANATHLLPQLIPAQLATARSFTEGIRASDLRDALLFDPRLVAYVNVLRQAKTDWDAHLRKRQNEAAEAASTPAPAPALQAAGATTNAAPSSVKLNSNSTGAVAFDPGNMYQPPHAMITPSANAKKLSDPALCLIWVNNDCEIATLDEKYLRLNGTFDPTTHEWHVKDRPRLDALLQMADIGARQGIAFAEKTEIDSSVLAMIYERASYQRNSGSDAAALDALRNYWRCALLGNMCWQLAHTRKAQPVEVVPVADTKPDKKGDKKKDETASKDEGKKDEAAATGLTPAASTNSVTVVNPSTAATSTHDIVTPNPQPPAPAPSPEPDNIPVAPIAHDIEKAVAPPAEVPAAPPAPIPVHQGPVVMPAASAAAATPPAAPAPPAPATPAAPAAASADDTSNIPVAPIATNMDEKPAAPAPAPAPVAAVTNAAPMPAPNPAQSTALSAIQPSEDDKIPVAPIAKAEDLTPASAPTTNAAPTAPIRPSAHPSDNADSHGLP